jgi:RpiR family carbohydrate utilization transcriptional regulator
LENYATIMAINNAYPDLFEQERKVAEYILKNSEAVTNMSVTELAEKSNVSDATIIRFSKKVGFKGFYHFKISLAKDIIDPETKISTHIDVENIKASIDNIFSYKIEEIKKTADVIDTTSVKNCIDLIVNCDSLYFFAAGNSNPVAVYAAYQFSQAGIKTVVNITPEMQINAAFSMGENDVAFGISNSGSTRMMLDVFEITQKRKIKSICITSYAKSPLAQLSDCTLHMVMTEKIFFEAFSSSRMMPMVVIDALLLLLSKNKTIDAYKHNSNCEQYLAKYKY